MRIPDAILDGLAARPDDVGVWQVLTDFLLENELPGASLAMCELQLMKGVSNPDLLGELSAARAARPKLPNEPWGGFEARWKCGFVTRLALDLVSETWTPQVYEAPAVQGLNALVLKAQYATAGDLDRLELMLSSAPKRVRRVSLRFDERGLRLTANEERRVLDTLRLAAPASVQRVDLVLGAHHRAADEALVAVGGRFAEVNCDGTTLPPDVELLKQLVNPERRFVAGGTGLAPSAELPFEHWLADEVEAWLELTPSGVVVPLTPAATANGFDAPSLPPVTRRWIRNHLRRDLAGWSFRERPLEPGSSLDLDGVECVFRQR